MYKYRKEDETSYCVGTTLTMELLLHRPAEAVRIYISPKQSRDETFEKVISLCRKNQIPVIQNNEKIFKEVSGKDNCMVLGEFRKFRNELDPKSNHVILVNPSNQGNLGTILRSCCGFGIRDVAIITPAADVFDPKCVRASMGAIFLLRFALFPSFEAYASTQKERAFYPFMLQAKAPLKDICPKAPWGLIFGNEATGLDPSFLKVGEPVIIPVSNAIDSLNLDNAAAIGIYEFTKNDL